MNIMAQNSQKLKKGFTRISHEDMAMIVAADLTAGGLKCLLFSLRETWGWQRDSFIMGYAGFQKNTRLSRPGVAKALQLLKNLHILTISEPGTPQQHRQTTYKINPIDQWQILTSKESLLVKPSIQNCMPDLTSTSKAQHTELVNTSRLTPPLKEKEREEKERGNDSFNSSFVGVATPTTPGVTSSNAKRGVSVPRVKRNEGGLEKVVAGSRNMQHIPPAFDSD